MQLLYDFDLTEKQKSQAENLVNISNVGGIVDIENKLFILDRNDVCGFIMLRMGNYKNMPFVFISYIFIKDKKRRKGLASNALFMLMNEYKLKNIVATIDNPNIASKKLFVRNGFLRDYDTNQYFKVN
jgi:predicted acetyltransferase